ncbi:MAG TPA: hypothetical protein VF316_19575 [Polyangiaceae bacterium]
MRGPSILAGLAIALAAQSALAQGADPAAAERLFRDGRKAVIMGNYVSACPMFEESHRLDPAPGTLLNLADCEEKRGQLARAWEHFRQLHDQLPSSDDRRAEAGLRAEAIEPRMPRLRIVVADARATVSRDGVTLGPASLGISLPVDPGHHVIVVMAHGHHERSYEVSLAEAEDKELDVTTGEPVVVTTGEPVVVTPSIVRKPDVLSPRIETSSAGNTQRTAGWVLGGAGVTALATGGALGIVALTKLSAAHQSCIGNICADAAAVGKYQSAQSFALATDVALGVGAVLLGTAIVLLLTSPHASATTLAHFSLTSIGGTW